MKTPNEFTYADLVEQLLCKFLKFHTSTEFFGVWVTTFPPWLIGISVSVSLNRRGEKL